MQISLSVPSSILHQVPEGHVGVYWRGGALLKIITPPGTLLAVMFIIFFFFECVFIIFFYSSTRVSSEAALADPL
jgi:hypothetical protein